MTKRYKDFIMLIMMLVTILLYSALRPTVTHVSLLEESLDKGLIEVANAPQVEVVETVVEQPKKPREVAYENAKARKEEARVAKEAEDARVAEEAAKTVRESAQPSRGSKREYQVTVLSTAYTPAPDEGGGIACDGNPAVPYHTIAVDPRVIPLGSKVYVPDIGWMYAHDTGGAIKGNRADVCLDTKKAAFAWGERRVTVTVIPPE